MGAKCPKSLVILNKKKNNIIIRRNYNITSNHDKTKVEWVVRVKPKKEVNCSLYTVLYNVDNVYRTTCFYFYSVCQILKFSYYRRYS